MSTPLDISARTQLDLIKNNFCISAILHDEAKRLTLCSPIEDKVKEPNASKSTLTQQAKKGKGPGHCIVKQWPFEKLPGAWGARNRAVLLDETIEPAIWQRLETVDHGTLYSRVAFSRFYTALRPGDDGNEESYRRIMAKVSERLTATAILFFLNQWLKPQNADHPDLPAVLAALRHFEVMEEYTNKNFRGDILRSDVVIQVSRNRGLSILKRLPGDKSMVTLGMANVKSTGNACHEFPSAFSSPTSHNLIATVDQSMDHTIAFATSQPTKGASVQELTLFLSAETNLQWPQMATSHFSQMAYELDVCASSCGMFSTIWGFHRIGLLKYPTPTDDAYGDEDPDADSDEDPDADSDEDANGDKILFVSDNLSAGRDRMDFISNQAIIEDLFFLIITSFLLAYGERIIPPDLRIEDFLSWFRG